MKPLRGSVPDSIRAAFRGVAHRKLARDVGALTGSNAVISAISAGQGIIVARLLGPESYGLVALAMSYPEILFSFFDARSADASVRYLNEFTHHEQRGRALATCKLGYMVDMAIALASLVVVCTTAWWAEVAIFHTSAIALLMIVYAAAFLPRSLAPTSIAVISVLGRFQLHALLQVTNTLIRAGLVIALVVAGFGPAGVIWGSAIATGLYGFLYAAIAAGAIMHTWGGAWWRSSIRELGTYRREILGFLFYNDVSVLLGLFVKQVDVVALAYFRSPVDVGYYRLARSIAGLPGNLVSPLQSVSYPRLARLSAAGEVQPFEHMVKSLALKLGLPLGALTLACVPAFPFIIELLAGGSYRGAIQPAQVLFSGSAAWLAFFWVRPTFLALGKVRAFSALALIGVTASALGMLASTYAWGLMGLAAWLAASQLWGHLLYAGWLVHSRPKALPGLKAASAS